MLELKGVRKVYSAGGETVAALRGVSVRFRASELVCILGPSGCGKTTLLNIIGGLDRCTSGELLIRGRPAGSCRERDWNAYRSRRVGFVFQSYNLIPHQTVLGNVELALTLAGVKKRERRRRALQALRAVGLLEQASRRPGELSGGQMQRVAIARALVNDPDVILADEPTGALDTETGEQVMELLRRASRDRLVIMVTHNAELAGRYATRIIRMLDGRIIADSRPFAAEEARPHGAEGPAWSGLPRRHRQHARQPGMSAATALGLSLRNLLSKKARTALTAAAGAVGILGIALILAVSQGMSAYIGAVQEGTLSSYPLVIRAQQRDVSALLSTLMETPFAPAAHDRAAVYERNVLGSLTGALDALDAAPADLSAFRAYLDARLADDADPLRGAVAGVQYDGGVEPELYIRREDGQVVRAGAAEALRQALRGANEPSGAGAAAVLSGMMELSSRAGLMQQLLPGDHGAPISDLVLTQYELVYGAWPDAWNEVLLVLDGNNELSDIALRALGMEPRGGGSGWDYAELCGRTLRIILPCDAWVRCADGAYTDLRTTQEGLSRLYEQAEEVRVTGIIRPAGEELAAMLTGALACTQLLGDYMSSRAEESAVVRAQRAQPGWDVLTGRPFRAEGMTAEDKAEGFRAAVAAMTAAEKADACRLLMSGAASAQMEALARQAMDAASPEALASWLSGLTAGPDVPAAILRAMSAWQGGAMAEQSLAFDAEGMTDGQISAALEALMSLSTQERLAQAYDAVMDFSSGSLAGNLSLLGCADAPESISIYASSFEGKRAVEEAVRAYNRTAAPGAQVSCADYAGMMLASVSAVVRAVTCVLIAFVAISLIVSSLMVGVITLISVHERTKEIGILRAMGASRRGISAVFNAETGLIGLASGVMGTAAAYALCIPMNRLLRSAVGIGSLRAELPIAYALALVACSVLLTLVAGLIPARSAARKDPARALRSE